MTGMTSQPLQFKSQLKKNKNKNKEKQAKEEEGPTYINNDCVVEKVIIRHYHLYLPFQKEKKSFVLFFLLFKIRV